MIIYNVPAWPKGSDCQIQGKAVYIAVVSSSSSLQATESVVSKGPLMGY